MKHPQYYILEAVEARNGCDDDEVSFRNDYSGRGMYGKKCVGITGPFHLCMEVIAEAVVFMADAARDVQMGSSADETHEFFAQSVKEVLRFDQDSMGRSNVILYWPDLESIPDEG